MTYYKCQFDDRPAGIVARLEGGTPSPNSVRVLGNRGATARHSTREPNLSRGAHVRVRPHT